MSEVILSRPEPGIAVLTIHRPDVRNALNRSVREQLAAHFDALGRDDQTRCIILTGGERVFAAGADLHEIAEATPIDMHLRQVQRLWQSISGCPKPVIAAVNGYALGGGCELAMHADIIVAGESASFGQPEIRVGIMPGAGGTQRLTRAIGKFQAMKMLLTGLPLSGKEAFAAGLASEVVEDGKVQERALELARLIASMPPLAATQIKEVLLAGQDASLDAGLMLERKAFHLLFASQDQKEGMQAFFEKRKPSYTGR
ncbi:MAG TPA: enoyl-CoA hydratase [Noviherbaspirillum sp.]|uniref:enoyl-CoA hydratase n=1 Tax=Noviherbaspirillum sp. TaxID=1926288 RepID=UPI002B4A309B|nr:enoyl-CoA hydratase [Noviherbaspirillum sp.]HJV84666.1 enoyl-CoA hydratase [Noviherbaspirillum sp.]